MSMTSTCGRRCGRIFKRHFSVSPRRSGGILALCVLFLCLFVLQQLRAKEIFTAVLVRRIDLAKRLRQAGLVLPEDQTREPVTNYNSVQADSPAAAPSPRHDHDDTADEQTQHFDAPSAIEGQWSRAFISDKQSVVSVLLRPLHFAGQQRNKRCKLGRTEGYVTEAYDGIDVHESSYNTAVVHCHFQGSDISSDLSDRVLEIGDGKESSLRVPIVTSRRPTRPFMLTACIPPLHGNLRMQWIGEWLEFHRDKIGTEHVFFYSSFAGMRERLTSEAGVNLQRTPFSVIDLSSQQKYKPYYFGQTTAIYDCLFLNRYLGTKWSLFQDLDEVLWLPKQWPSPVQFFAKKEKDCDAISFGTWPVEIGHCRPLIVGGEKKTLIERMTSFGPKPYCGPLCLDWQGRRKYAVRIDGKVNRLNVHTAEPDIPGRLCNFNIDDGHLNNYWRAVDANIAVCEKILP